MNHWMPPPFELWCADYTINASESPSSMMYVNWIGVGVISERCATLARPNVWWTYDDSTMSHMVGIQHVIYHTWQDLWKLSMMCSKFGRQTKSALWWEYAGWSTTHQHSNIVMVVICQQGESVIWFCFLIFSARFSWCEHFQFPIQNARAQWQLWPNPGRCTNKQGLRVGHRVHDVPT